MAAFAAYRFGDQKRFCLRMVEAGRVKLDEFHVGDAAASAPAHGDAVAGGDIRVAGVQVDLARAAGGEHGKAAGDGDDLVGVAIQNIAAEALIVIESQLVAGDQVDRDMVFEDVDIRVLFDLADQCGLDGAAGAVGGVDDTAMTVATLACQVQGGGAVGLGLAGEGYATIDEPLDGAFALRHGVVHDLFVAQAGTGLEGVLDVGVDGVAFVDDRRDAALGIIGGALGERAFGDDGDAGIACQMER